MFCQVKNIENLSEFFLQQETFLLRICFLIFFLGQACETLNSQMIILYLDDLQWADEPSLAIVEALLCSTDVHLMFIGSCRYIYRCCHGNALVITKCNRIDT